MPDSVRDHEYTLRMGRARMVMNEGPRLVTLTANLARSSEPSPELSRAGNAQAAQAK
jgi:hypothetical protein